MRTFYILLIIVAIAIPVGYSQRNTGGAVDDGRLEHNDKNKVSNPKLVPRNQGTRPIHENPPQPPAGGQPVVIDAPFISIEEPDTPPGYCQFIPPEPPIANPVSYVDYKALGKSQFDNADYYSAIESFQLALTTDTSDYSLFYQIGITQIELERYTDAIHSLSKYINSVEINGIGYYQRGLAKFYLGNKDKALADFLIADQLNIEDATQMLKRFYGY